MEHGSYTLTDKVDEPELNQMSDTSSVNHQAHHGDPDLSMSPEETQMLLPLSKEYI